MPTIDPLLEAFCAAHGIDAREYACIDSLPRYIRFKPSTPAPQGR